MDSGEVVVVIESRTTGAAERKRGKTKTKGKTEKRQNEKKTGKDKARTNKEEGKTERTREGLEQRAVVTEEKQRKYGRSRH